MTRPAIAAIAVLAGCNLVFGVDEPELAPGAGGASAVTSTSSKSASGSGQGGGGGAPSVGGSGGVGTTCMGDAVTCYNCCAQLSDTGQSDFQAAYPDCGCTDGVGSCVETCKMSLCAAGQMPSEPCISCIVGELKANQGCIDDPNFNCTTSTPCGEFVLCLQQCRP